MNKIYLTLIFLTLMFSVIAYAAAKDIEIELSKASKKVLKDNKIENITYNMTCFDDDFCMVKIYTNNKQFAIAFGNKTSIEETVRDKVKSHIILLLKPVPKPVIKSSQAGNIMIKEKSGVLDYLDKVIEALIKLVQKII